MDDQNDRINEMRAKYGSAGFIQQMKSCIWKNDDTAESPNTLLQTNTEWTATTPEAVLRQRQNERKKESKESKQRMTGVD